MVFQCSNDKNIFFRIRNIYLILKKERSNKSNTGILYNNKIKESEHDLLKFNLLLLFIP